MILGSGNRASSELHCTTKFDSSVIRIIIIIIILTAVGNGTFDPRGNGNVPECGERRLRNGAGIRDTFLHFTIILNFDDRHGTKRKWKARIVLPVRANSLFHGFVQTGFSATNLAGEARKREQTRDCSFSFPV